MIFLLPFRAMAVAAKKQKIIEDLVQFLKDRALDPCRHVTRPWQGFAVFEHSLSAVISI